ncbi:hypothetical protein AG1IA_09025 [Rhizoctonia solani AG-1 IA]|uniref:Uncharacterized protein n=1 Tax=Thanatephorus cucumeris (strain AG1-IA) TaxID=983506 RepID=L8WKQ6_THACA|nr:hypothetical protein AG1IA_09025 [Rhizoctonia solani AG-1 IA]
MEAWLVDQSRRPLPSGALFGVICPHVLRSSDPGEITTPTSHPPRATYLTTINQTCKRVSTNIPPCRACQPPETFGHLLPLVFLATNSEEGVAASVPSYVERARSRRTISMLGDLEANRTKDVFEVPYPPWSQTYTKSNEELASIKNKAVREFYEKQNQTLAKFEEVDQLLSGELVHHVLYSFENPSESTRLLSPENSISKREKDKERLSAFGLTVINTNLFLGKGVAVLLSGSVSIWASFVDTECAHFYVNGSCSVCPVLSLVLKGREIKGGRRFVFQLIETPGAEIGRSAVSMEPLGVVIFSGSSVFLISTTTCWLVPRAPTPSDTLNFVTGVEGCKRLLSGSREEFSLDKTTIAIMVVTIATKTVAWLLSAQIKSNGVQALAQGLAGATNLPWLDPLGGLNSLIRMLYLITRFTTPQVSYLEVYHAGTELICEADVQFPKQTSFEEVHNVSEAIQVSKRLSVLDCQKLEVGWLGCVGMPRRRQSGIHVSSFVEGTRVGKVAEDFGA